MSSCSCRDVWSFITNVQMWDVVALFCWRGKSACVGGPQENTVGLG